MRHLAFPPEPAADAEPWAEASRREAHAARLRALGQLTAEVVHELRQPLVALKGSAELLRDLPQDAVRGRARVQAILEQAERIDRLVDRILRHAAPAGRPEAGGPRSSVNDAIAAALTLVGGRIRGSSVRIELALTAGLPPVGVEAVELEQIFVNLVCNALEAIGPRVGRIRLGTRGDGHAVLADVEDDGPGIAPELRGRLFEPFVTGRPGGTGLGLHVSRTTAAAAGGTLELVDATSGGHLRLRLPAREG